MNDRRTMAAARRRRRHRSLAALALGVAAVVATPTPASAEPYACTLGAFGQQSLDLPITVNGPASVNTGETSTLNVVIAMSGALAKAPNLAGSVASMTVKVTESPGVDLLAEASTATGYAGATIADGPGGVNVTVPGPIEFGPTTRLPDLTLALKAKLTPPVSLAASAISPTLSATIGSTNPIPVEVVCSSSATTALYALGASGSGSGTGSAAATTSTTLDAGSTPGQSIGLTIRPTGTTPSQVAGRSTTNPATSARSASSARGATTSSARSGTLPRTGGSALVGVALALGLALGRSGLALVRSSRGLR